MQQTQPDLSPGRMAVLALLKREGPISADSLAEKLKLTPMAVRLHLGALSMEDFAAYTEEPRKRGRPVQMWRVTPKANPYFADAHAALTTDLIAQMKKAFGDEGMEKILRLRTQDQEKSYRAQMTSKQSLKARLESLAKIRSAEGYMADVRRDSATGDLLFVENHCPVCAAAKLCQGLCREELSLFRRVIGPDVKVERVTHILAGATRCAYRVTPV